MAEKRRIRVWYDPEGDYLEVLLDQEAGAFRKTESDHILVKKDEAGNLLGFSILKVSALKKAPLEVEL